MGELRHRELKPGETIFGGGKGGLIPLKSTPIAPAKPPQQSIPVKTPEQLRELAEAERAMSIEAYEAMTGRRYREEEHGQEKPER